MESLIGLLLLGPGLWLPLLVGVFKQLSRRDAIEKYVDTGNERSLIEIVILSFIGSLITYATLIVGIVYLFHHLRWA